MTNIINMPGKMTFLNNYPDVIRRAIPGHKPDRGPG